jgi:hypothetical protein
VAEQVVQVARETQAFLGDGQARELLPRVPELRDGGDLADKGGGPEAEGDRGDHELGQAGGGPEHQC